jgi:hypothetical protein
LSLFIPISSQTCMLVFDESRETRTAYINPIVLSSFDSSTHPADNLYLRIGSYGGNGMCIFPTQVYLSLI